MTGHINPELHNPCVILVFDYYSRKRRKYQTEQRNVFTIKTLLSSSTNAVLTGRLGLG